MKKNYIKPDITILKIGSSNGMCALSSEKKRNGLSQVT